MPTKVKHLILGAGPTGLGAGYRLRERGIEDFLILEAASGPGGLAKSLRDSQGFLWDIGGHVQFSHYAYFDQLMNLALPAQGWQKHQRESYVWIYDRFVPYPFQNNLKYLPPDVTQNCLQSLLALREDPTRPKPENFKAWIMKTFGAGIAEIFMLPYNFKVWATPSELMDYRWIGERVSVPPRQRIVDNVALNCDDRSWGPNDLFRYPTQGGTGAIWESVAALVGKNHLQFDAAVVRVSAQDRTVELENRETIQFETCLSTVPLDLFTAMISDLSPEVKRRAAELKHASTHVVGIGMEGGIPEALKGKCWMYFPESNCPFYRATVFSHYSKHNVPSPDTQWSLMLETSESPYKPVDRSRLIAEVIEGLHATKLIGPETKILSKFLYSVAYGYPVPTLDRDTILSDVHPALESSGIYSRGRFGGWKYEVSNQDHSAMQGVEWVDHILDDAPETTYLTGSP